MGNLKIGPRVYVIVAIMALVGAIAFGMAYQGMNDVRATYDNVTRDRAPVTRVIDNIRAAIPDMNLQVFSVLIPEFPKTFIDQQITDMGTMEKDFRAVLADWDKNAANGASPKEQKLFEQLKTDSDAWFTTIHEYNANIVKWSTTGDASFKATAFASNDSGAVDASTKKLQATLDLLMKANVAENKTVAAEAVATQDAALTRLAVTVGLTLLVGLVIAIMIASSITRPVHDAVAFADNVAAGNFDAKITKHAGGEIGDLTRAVESMKESLVARVEQMREVAATVEIAADGVTDTAAEVIDVAGKAGNKDLVTAGEKLSHQAGNLKRALGSFKG
jgi:nitrogen fixation/metabolism regulation signal transduction histidine kinase